MFCQKNSVDKYVVTLLEWHQSCCNMLDVCSVISAALRFGSNDGPNFGGAYRCVVSCELLRVVAVAALRSSLRTSVLRILYTSKYRRLTGLLSNSTLRFCDFSLSIGYPRKILFQRHDNINSSNLVSNPGKSQCRQLFRPYLVHPHDSFSDVRCDAGMDCMPRNSSRKR